MLSRAARAARASIPRLAAGPLRPATERSTACRLPSGLRTTSGCRRNGGRGVRPSREFSFLREGVAALGFARGAGQRGADERRQDLGFARGELISWGAGRVAVALGLGPRRA